MIGEVTWKLAEAKNRLSEVMNLVFEEGPQIVTRRSEKAVLISWDEYQELKGEKSSFKSMLMQEHGLDELDLSRDQSSMREVEL